MEITVLFLPWSEHKSEDQTRGSKTLSWTLQHSVHSSLQVYVVFCEVRKEATKHYVQLVMFLLWYMLHSLNVNDIQLAWVLWL